MSQSFIESVVEQAALAWPEGAGWQIRAGAEIALGEPAAERDDYGQVILAQGLHEALTRLNSALPAQALEDAFYKVTQPGGAELIVRARAQHRLLAAAVVVCGTGARVTPSAQVMQAFEKRVRPLFERIVQVARESRTLTTLCDRLLPKLISGELRIAKTRRLIKVTT